MFVRETVNAGSIPYICANTWSDVSRSELPIHTDNERNRVAQLGPGRFVPRGKLCTCVMSIHDNGSLLRASKPVIYAGSTLHKNRSLQGGFMIRIRAREQRFARAPCV